MATTDGYFPPFPQDTAFPAYAQFSAPPPAGFATAPPAQPPLTSAYSSPGFGASPGFAASPYPPQSPYSTPGSSMYSPGSSYSLPDSPSSATTRSRARAEHFGERPRAWRPDFSMRGPGLAALLPSLPRRNSTAGIPSFTLNERIRYAALREPPVVYDLRHDLSRIQLRELKRPVTNYDLTRYVTEPPMAHMRLYHPRLPWYVDVNTPGQAGATMYDVFTVLARVLLSRVKDHDLYNAEVLNEDRARITQAWKERCQYDDRAMAQGVLKVDFLTRDCIFIGLAKGRDGMFEIKTRKV
ncbi:hypothetical protein FA95DRAFT_809633 [Auriscalpium vulgare]|uniref:Uncharacterized protein n=1 Tax=Auriscalpium vulgare TaxID=40419 RepID=A0ACB8R9R4_9AGAM|nr:hypothetical protein FA95DRAFT_809633 [Auriscalpium vulgare]